MQLYEIVTPTARHYTRASVAAVKAWLKGHAPDGEVVVYACEAPDPSVGGYLELLNGNEPERTHIVPLGPVALDADRPEPKLTLTAAKVIGGVVNTVPPRVEVELRVWAKPDTAAFLVERSGADDFVAGIALHLPVPRVETPAEAADDGE